MIVRDAILQWDRRITRPAMALVWVLGLSLAAWGGWMGQAWLAGKIALVLALSALHGVLAATLRRRMGSQTAATLPWLRYGPAAVAACAAAIAVLVVASRSAALTPVHECAA